MITSSPCLVSSNPSEREHSIACALSSNRATLWACASVPGGVSVNWLALWVLSRARHELAKEQRECLAILPSSTIALLCRSSSCVHHARLIGSIALVGQSAVLSLSLNRDLRRCVSIGQNQSLHVTSDRVCVDCTGWKGNTSVNAMRPHELNVSRALLANPLLRA